MSAEKIPSPTSNTSFMATWFAPPPIHDPASVDMPRHTASGPSPPTVSGDTIPTTNMANGPPSTMLSVAVRNITSARGPRPKTPLRSMLRVSRIRLAGSR